MDMKKHVCIYICKFIFCVSTLKSLTGSLNFPIKVEGTNAPSANAVFKADTVDVENVYPASLGSFHLFSCMFLFNVKKPVFLFPSVALTVGLRHANKVPKNLSSERQKCDNQYPKYIL